MRSGDVGLLDSIWKTWAMWCDLKPDSFVDRETTAASASGERENGMKKKRESRMRGKKSSYAKRVKELRLAFRYCPVDVRLMVWHCNYGQDEGIRILGN